MPRPKNMTPEQNAAWKQARNEKERAMRASDPEFKAKMYARNNKSMRKRRATNDEFNEQQRIYMRSRGQLPEVKKNNALRMRHKYETDAEFAERMREYQRTLKVKNPSSWRKKVDGSIRRTKAIRILDQEFKHHMNQIENDHAEQIE